MGARRWGIAVVTAVLVASLVACGSDDGEDAGPPPRRLDTSAPPGFVVASDSKVGFALTLPAGWRQLPLDLGRFDTEAEKVKAEGTNVGTGLVQLKSAVRSGANFAAIDPATGSTVNLIVLGAAEDKFDKTVDQIANQLRANGATGLRREETTVDGLPAARQQFRQRLPGETGAVDVNTTQLYVRRRGQDYILSLSGDSPELEAIAASFKLV